MQTTSIEHLNAGWLHSPPNPKVCCHCLLLRDAAGVALVDTGIGLQDVRDPAGRVGRDAIELAGFQFAEADTALRQLERRGIRGADVRHLILTHLDPDHAGGIADFPKAAVHVSAEEYAAATTSGDPRYRPIQFDYGPKWVTHPLSGDRWFGMEARRIEIGFASEIYLVPLFGHTAGHCGVAIGKDGRWTFHVGDAYYLRAELADEHHPVDAIAAARSVDNGKRVESLNRVRPLAHEHAGEIELVGYHDVQELPRSAGRTAAG